MHVDDCKKTLPVFQSPMAQFANRLMQGDKSKGEYGMLMRTVDYFDMSSTEIYDVMEQHGVFEDLKRDGIPVPKTLPPLKTLSSSYLHGSIRAAGGMYQNVFEKEQNQFDFSLLYATKFARNTIFKDFQEDDSSKLLDCEYTYLYDAGTVDRGTVFEKSNCWRIPHMEMCLEDQCAARAMGARCHQTNLVIS